MSANHPNLFPPKFHHGKVYATPAALALGVDFTPFIDRHVRGDWGDALGFGDQQLNDAALVAEDRLLSKYQVGVNTFLYIITEADRSVTTVLLPEEY